MSNFTRMLARSAAAAAATALVAAGGLAPALADDGDGADRGHGPAADHGRQGPKQDKGDQGRQGPKQDKGDHGREGPKDKGDQSQARQDEGNQGRGDERGNGHTPVTVCHLLGNGGYHVLTFDDNALQAHVNHGDIYPVPADGCPQDTTDETVPGTTPQSDDTPGDDSEQTPVVEDDTTTNDATVAGVEQFASDGTPRTGQVLGTEAVAGLNRTAPAAGPLAGVLPQTGAGRFGLAAGLGLALIGAGAALVARRRTQAV
jgi:LPXTG-motif cell wall-anchored protein